MALSHIIAFRGLDDVPVVLAGDLNAEPDSDEVRLLAGRRFGDLASVLTPYGAVKVLTRGRTASVASATRRGSKEFFCVRRPCKSQSSVAPRYSLSASPSD